MIFEVDSVELKPSFSSETRFPLKMSVWSLKVFEEFEVLKYLKNFKMSIWYNLPDFVALQCIGLEHLDTVWTKHYFSCYWGIYIIIYYKSDFSGS